MRHVTIRVAVVAALALLVPPLAATTAGAASGTVPASTPIGARQPFAQTNGDILDITKVAGASRDLIAFGGNFTAVITPDGVSHPATNFAVVDEFTGALVYAGNASSYVRTISSRGGTIYVGGDFMSFAGATRTHLAALSPSFALTSWNPAPTFNVRTVLATQDGVYYGGDGGTARLASEATGATTWSQPVSGGSVRSFALSPDGAAVYVGGLFEVFGGLTQHGLIKANPLTGVPDPTFNAHLRPDSGVGAHADYDGEAASRLLFSADATRLLAGIAGYGADEFKIFDPTTGALILSKVLIGDCQAVAIVGSTYVVGYHRNNANTTIPYPYFAAQLEASNLQLTDWDPGLTGFQSNADGGNNGVQAAYADPVNRRLFVAGAFTSPVKALAVYTWAQPVNQPPTASFTSTATGLSIGVDGTASSDVDGHVATWAWDFGDGTTGSGATAAHTYAAAGTYTVTLTVTDDRGATASTSRVVVVPPSSKYALDSFSRTSTGTWGDADLGGAWTITGTTSVFSVANGVGSIALAPTLGVRASLDAVSRTATDASVTFASGSDPSGGGTYLALVGRRVDPSDDYRLKLRLQAGGAVTAQLVKVVAGAETAIQTLATVPGLTVHAGDRLRARLVVTGTGTTTLTGKVWNAAGTEPSAWQLQATDATTVLQRPGGVGIWAYLSAASTPSPSVVSVDDLSAGPPA